jgi:hypothetical protein
MTKATRFFLISRRDEKVKEERVSWRMPNDTQKYSTTAIAVPTPPLLKHQRKQQQAATMMCVIVGCDSTRNYIEWSERVMS